ncbi:hypothetical protein P303_06880 [Xylella fastidiosa MUL0034]|nr:hypothetical protein P303_06880 [Xylella fastidiosa MUL0034]
MVCVRLQQAFYEVCGCLHHCTIAPLHHCTIAPLHHCTKVFWGDASGAIALLGCKPEDIAHTVLFWWGTIAKVALQ